MEQTTEIQAFIDMGNDKFVSAIATQKADIATKKKVIARLREMIRNNQAEIKLWKRTIAFIHW